MGGQDLKGYLKGTLKVPLKGTFERRGRAQPPRVVMPDQQWRDIESRDGTDMWQHIKLRTIHLSLAGYKNVLLGELPTMRCTTKVRCAKMQELFQLQTA